MFRTKFEFCGRLPAAIAVFTTVLCMCIENVKAFLSSESLPSVISNLVQTSSMAAWMSRFPTTVRKFHSTDDTTAVSYAMASIGSFLSTKAKQASRTTTSLAASWSFNDMASFSVNTLNSASLRPFGSWYNELDPRVRPPVYEEWVPRDYLWRASRYTESLLTHFVPHHSYSNVVLDYSFSSPSDNWPSLYYGDDDDDIVPKARDASKEELFRPSRIRPLRALRRAATRALSIMPIKRPRPEQV